MPATYIHSLNSLIADFNIFGQKVKHFYWHADGHVFTQLRTIHRQLISDNEKSIMKLSKRVCLLDGQPASSFHDFIQISNIQEETNTPPVHSFIDILVNDLNSIIESLHSTADEAEEYDDSTTVFIIQLITQKKKNKNGLFANYQIKKIRRNPITICEVEMVDIPKRSIKTV